MKILSTSVAIAVSLLALGSARPSHAKEPAKPAIDPDAISALQKMGAFLRDQACRWPGQYRKADRYAPPHGLRAEGCPFRILHQVPIEQ